MNKINPSAIKLRLTLMLSPILALVIENYLFYRDISYFYKSPTPLVTMMLFQLITNQIQNERYAKVKHDEKLLRDENRIMFPIVHFNMFLILAAFVAKIIYSY